MKRLIPYILVLLLSLPTVFNLMRPGYFPMHDDLQSIRVYGMTQCIEQGQIPCRWVADMGYGYGYPQFNFYGPLPYYVMSLFNYFGVGVFDSVKIGFALSLLLGNLAMFALAQSLFGNVYSALLATLVYAYAPYRASDLYSRGAMGESWAFVFMPMILLGIKKLTDKQNWKNLVFTGLGFALLMATHNITTLIFTPVALIWGGVLFLRHHGKLLDNIISAFKWLLGSVAWGTLLSAFFVFPVLFEKRFAHVESMIGGYFDYRAHFVTLKQLFLTSFWGFGSSQIGPTDDLSFFFSPIMLLLLLVAAVLVIRSLVRKRYKMAIPVALLMILGLFSAFMTHEKSSIVWSAIPTLVYLQFPWRFLTTANFFFALAAGFVLYAVRPKISAIILMALFLVTFLISVSYFRPLTWYKLTEAEKFAGDLFDKQMTISIFDYLPTSAKMPPNAPAPVLPTSSAIKSSVTDYKTSADSLSFNFTTQENTIVKLNRLYFPGWIVTVNGKKTEPKYGPDGIIFLRLDPGSYHITAGLRGTPVRDIADLLTIVFIPLTFIALYKKNE